MDTRTKPNHHANHPGFSGATGLIAALSFLKGRSDQAARALDLAAVRAGDRLVDIGCGPGVAARLAAGRGADVIGVDPAPVMLRVARLHRVPRQRTESPGTVDWRIGSAETVPVETDWATVVWSLATVHHWIDIDKGLDEINRVLTPGGRMVVIERKIAADATGHGSHGWTRAQADSFAVSCDQHGLLDVSVEERAADGGPVLLSVYALSGQPQPWSTATARGVTGP
jgi:SAM-dependent methyltransferase